MSAPLLDPLLDCLLQLTRLYGRPCSAAHLCAGLPLQGALTPALMVRAARRADLACKIGQADAQKIEPALLPVVLLLHGQDAVLLLGWQADGQARLLMPAAGEAEVLLPADELQRRYSGCYISCRPQFQWHAANANARPALHHWFWDTVRAQRKLFYDVLLAALLINLFGLGLPLYTMNVYDRVVPNFAEESLWALSLGLFLVLVFDATLRLVRSHFIELASARIDTELSARVMQRVLGLRLAERPASVGAFAANLRAFEMVRDFITSATLATLVDLPFALLFLIALGTIAWQLMCLPVLGAVLLLLYSALVQRRMQVLSEATLQAQARRNALLVESLSALESVQAQGGEARVQAQWEQASGVLARVHAKLRGLAATSIQGVLSTQQLVNLALVIYGVYLIHARQLSLGGLIAATMLSGRALAPLGQMVGLLLQWANVKNSLATLNQIMHSRDEATSDDGQDSTSLSKSASSALPDAPAHPNSSPQHGQPAGATNLPTSSLPLLSLHDVHFSYPGSARATLRGISFQIYPGEKVAIIGRVGSGKSTLQKLLLGLYAPESGSIRLNDRDYRQLSPHALRRNIGYCEQDTRLFSCTLRENLNLRQPAQEDEVLWQALEVAGLAETVRHHPDGLNWPISERGESLSGGQRQALALARALVSDAPILLLDEPSSALDFSSEARFKQQLRQHAAGKTVLLITHRASLMDLAERLIVLDDGKVMADGARDEIIAALQSGKIGRAA
jgi:ATP-binding cassette subfamily C protein LapB